MPVEQPDPVTSQYINTMFRAMPSQSGARFWCNIENGAFGLAMPPAIEGQFEINITARVWSQIEEQVPGLPDILDTAQGKVVFIGNGLSPVPLDLAERFGEGTLSDRPVISDQFDYFRLESDFRSIQATLQAEKLSDPGHFVDYLGYIKGLCDALRDGVMSQVPYAFGRDDPPVGLQDAALVVNVFGPPPYTIREELSLLALGGSLVFASSFDNAVRDPRFTSDYLRLPSGDISATMITRISG